MSVLFCIVLEEEMSKKKLTREERIQNINNSIHKAVNWDTEDDDFTQAFWDQNVKQLAARRGAYIKGYT